MPGMVAVKPLSGKASPFFDGKNPFHSHILTIENGSLMGLSPESSIYINVIMWSLLRQLPKFLNIGGIDYEGIHWRLN